MSSYNWSPLQGGGSGSSGVSSLNSLTGDLTIAGGTGISVGTAGSTITITNTQNPLTLAAVGTSPNANGATLSTQVLNLEPASASFPGVVSTTTQSFAGNKTFTGTIAASNLSGTNTGDVTLGTANGLSLVGQALSLAAASGSTTGALTSTDWTTFNNKQAAGNYITALTGDATASGPGSATLTLATVNADAGSFGSSTAIPSFTVNAKGLITAASTNAVVAPAGTLTGTALASNVVTSSLTAVGTIATGTWNATAISTAKGGTGQDLSASTGALSVAAGTVSAGTLSVGNGGTGQTSYTNGQLLIGNTTGNTLTKATLTAGSGISITNGAGSISIAASPITQSTVWLSNGNGFGSTATKIRRYSSTVLSTGSDITYADSATNGATFTINTAGCYSMWCTDVSVNNAFIGFSKNASSTTTSINSLSVANGRLSMQPGIATGFVEFCSSIVWCAANDVIRPHFDGSQTDTSDAVTFYITRVV